MWGSSLPGWRWHYNGARQGEDQEVGISLRVSRARAGIRLWGAGDASRHGRLA
jgi:hypothetical protein